MLLVEEGEKVEAVHPRRPLLRETARDVHVRAVPDRDVVVERAVEEELAREEPVHRLARPRRVDALRDDGALQPRPRQRAALPVGAELEEAGGGDRLALHRVGGAAAGVLRLQPAPVHAADADVRPHRLGKGGEDLVEPHGRGRVEALHEGEERALVLPHPRDEARQDVERGGRQGTRLRQKVRRLGPAVDAAEPAVRHDRLHRGGARWRARLRAVSAGDDVGEEAVELAAVLHEADQLEAALDLAPLVPRRLVHRRGVGEEVLVEKERQARRRGLRARRPLGEALHGSQLTGASLGDQRLQVPPELIPHDSDPVGRQPARFIEDVIERPGGDGERLGERACDVRHVPGEHHDRTGGVPGGAAHDGVGEGGVDRVHPLGDVDEPLPVGAPVEDGERPHPGRQRLAAAIGGDHHRGAARQHRAGDAERARRRLVVCEPLGRGDVVREIDGGQERSAHEAIPMRRK